MLWSNLNVGVDGRGCFSFLHLKMSPTDAISCASIPVVPVACMFFYQMEGSLSAVATLCCADYAACERQARQLLAWMKQTARFTLGRR